MSVLLFGPSVEVSNGSNTSPPLLKRFRAFFMVGVPSVEVQLAYAAGKNVIVCTKPSVSPTSVQRAPMTNYNGNRKCGSA